MDPQAPTPPQEVTAEGAARPPGRRRPGPKTDAGKSQVAGNAIQHALCATTPVIPGVERAEDWEAHRAGVLKSLAPVGHLETVLAERVALALWRLKRVAAYEQAELAEAPTRGGDSGSPAHLLPEHKLDKLVRYEAHVHRQFCQTLHELEALQDRRRGRPTPLARMDVHGVPEAS